MFQVGTGNICHQVTKPIDVEDFPLDPRGPERRRAWKRQADIVIDRFSKLGRLDPEREMGDDGRKDVAAVKGSADGMKEIPGSSDGPDTRRFGLLRKRGQESVVRANEQMAVAGHQDWAARPADPWVNH